MAILLNKGMFFYLSDAIKSETQSSNPHKTPNTPNRLRYVWWLLAFVLFPYFRYTGRQHNWTNPQDPKMLIVSYVLNFVLPIVDVITDVITSYGYFFVTKDPMFGLVTFFATFLPFLSKLI